MPPFILITVLVLVFLVLGLVVFIAIWMRRSNQTPVSSLQDGHPQGYRMGTGISIGVGFGVALGLALDNLALGIAMGAGIGTAIGAAMEQKNKDQIRPLTEQEKRIQRWGVVTGLLILLVVVGVFNFDEDQTKICIYIR